MSDDTPQPIAVRHLGFCRYCGRTVHDQSFPDESAHRLYVCSAVCAACQDCLHFNPCTDDVDQTPTPVLHGTVFAAAVRDGVELALLPFQYDPWHAQFDYEPANIVRAGPALAPVDPFVELAAIRSAWDGRLERLLLVDSLGDPLLSLRILHNHMVVAFDGAVAAAAEALVPGLRRPPLVDLTSAVDWTEAFGAPLEEFIRARGAPEPAGCLPPLRQAALVARLLELEAPAGPHRGRPVFEHVLLSVAPPEAAATEDCCDACH